MKLEKKVLLETNSHKLAFNFQSNLKNQDGQWRFDKIRRLCLIWPGACLNKGLLLFEDLLPTLFMNCLIRSERKFHQFHKRSTNNIHPVL